MDVVGVCQVPYSLCLHMSHANARHRSNMAANCHRGWRVRLISGPAGSQTDMTFFNNTAHASGFGWHLKPPHAPPTLNNFLSFTAFRCGTGMFYYGTGNIFHDNHRFIECGTGHFMNHLSNGLHTAPFYHNLYLVGNIDPASTTSRMGRGIRSAKDNEYFYVSGVTAINLHGSAAFEGCFETVCTMRYERCRWFNSTKRTVSGSKMAGIFWDMDGTLTGYPNGFVSKFYEYNTFPGKCQISSEHENGIVCGASDGSVRVRRLYVNQQEPWQLDGKTMRVITSAGYDEVQYDFFKLKGWGVPVVENETYDMRVNDPNDFQKLGFQYSERNYVMEEHGYYNKTTPKSEDILVHLNYTDWRDHFDGTTGSAAQFRKILQYRVSTVMNVCSHFVVSSRQRHFCPLKTPETWQDYCRYPNFNRFFCSRDLCHGGSSAMALTGWKFPWRKVCDPLKSQALAKSCKEVLMLFDPFERMFRLGVN